MYKYKSQSVTLINVGCLVRLITPAGLAHQIYKPDATNEWNKANKDPLPVFTYVMQPTNNDRDSRE